MRYQAAISLAHLLTQKSLSMSLIINFYRPEVAVHLLSPAKKHFKEYLGDPGTPKGTQGVLLQGLVIFKLTKCHHHYGGEGAQQDPQGEHDPRNEALERSQTTSF